MTNEIAGGIPLEALKEAAEKGTVALREKEERLEQLRAEVDRARSELKLMRQLIDLHEGAPAVRHLSDRHNTSPAGLSRRDELLQVVEEMLVESGEPMAIGDIMDTLGENRRLLPGQQSQANLISVIRSDERFIRSERGVYGLAAWGGEEYLPPSKKKRPKRRVTK